MYNIEISLSKLQRDISELESAYQGLVESAKRGQEAMHNLGRTWEGSAHEAFEKQLQADFQMIEIMEQSIQYMIECFKYAKEEYAKCENESYECVSKGK